MLVDDAVLEFEPLGSEIHINELYIGGNSIFKETLENLWQSGINHLTLVVEKCKASKFDKYQRRFNFGRRDGYIDVDILALNVDRVLPGTVLREIYAIVDQLDDFILLYWNTLLTVPLYDPLESHRARRKESPRYAMSAIYFKDSQKRGFSGESDDCVIVFDGNSELVAYQAGTDKMRLNVDCLQKLKNDTILSVRYDLCKAGIYICNKTVAEHYTNWFEHAEIDEYIVDCLSREFKTDEIYITILQPDVIFPNFPPALRIRTPKDYHSVYMEYITRFQDNRPLSQKPVSNYQPQFGPMVLEGAMFTNNSAFMPPFKKTKYLFTSVFNSIVGQKVTVGKHTTVERCIIYNDVTIGKNCSIKDSIIMNGVDIANDTIIPPGSIVCSEAHVTPALVEGITGSLRASNVPAKYIDLTKEEDLGDSGSRKVGKVYVWPINAFGDIEATYIGRSFYDLVRLKTPADSLAEVDSDEDDDSETGSDASDPDDVDTAQEPADDVEGEMNETHTVIDYEIVNELSALTIECLENPKQLPNKVLEIKSLKISHNLQKAGMVKIAFEYGLCWIIERSTDEEGLREWMEKSCFKQLLDSFEYQMVETDHYMDIVRVCADQRRDLDFVSQVCEALYHLDIMDFEGLQTWLHKNNVSGSRINMFAAWIAED